MARPLSKIAPNWWDYTTLPPELLKEVAKLKAEDLLKLSRPGFKVLFYDTLEEFYLAEALEYIHAWRQATDSQPAGICGPIGPTEQLPLVARIVNAIGLKLHNAHFWGMDEWVENGRPVPVSHPLSFAKADLDLCFNRIRGWDALVPRLFLVVSSLRSGYGHALGVTCKRSRPSSPPSSGLPSWRPSSGLPSSRLSLRSSWPR